MAVLDPTDGIERCAYRGPNGMKCAAGHLIPDEQYSPKMEGWSVSCFTSEMKDNPFHNIPDIMNQPQFVRKLQEIHDDYTVPAWEQLWQEFALEHDLIYTPPLTNPPAVV
jgi:hypothetical protein